MQSLTQRRLDATVPRCHDARRDDAKRNGAKRDDADGQCSRHMHGLTMGPCMMRVDTDCQCMKTTTPIYNATMPRCQRRRCYATMPTRCHDAESRHENDDVDWLLHDDTNPCWLVAWQRHKSDVDWPLNSGKSVDAAAYCCFYTASKPRCAVTWRAITANASSGDYRNWQNIRSLHTR